MILLDTHVLLWLDQGRAELGAAARRAADAALCEDDLAVSAISEQMVPENLIPDPAYAATAAELHDQLARLLEQSADDHPLKPAFGARGCHLIDA